MIIHIAIQYKKLHYINMQAGRKKSATGFISWFGTISWFDTKSVSNCLPVVVLHTACAGLQTSKIYIYSSITDGCCILPCLSLEAHWRCRSLKCSMLKMQCRRGNRKDDTGYTSRWKRPSNKDCREMSKIIGQSGIQSGIFWRCISYTTFIILSV